ncbi:CHAP domain-containing protein [Rathayibacter sp. Leaf294]|uniref:CHAP domain-containing protein n=1 Tax=Rathayibacter sp. Leaf294 TaxID=1736326 RepID=UPI003FA74DC5
MQDSYGCTGGGYTGTDSWGYSNSSSTASNGTKHNCTSYAAFRVAQNGARNPGNLGSAGSWDDNARKYGIPVDGYPRVGDIAQYNSGHVAYVEEVGNGYIVTTDDNYGYNYTTRKRISAGSTYPQWPDNFIHFTSSISKPTTKPSDFDGDGKSDLLYQDVGSTTLRLLTSAGTTYKGAHVFVPRRRKHHSATSYLRRNHIQGRPRLRQRRRTTSLASHRRLRR